MKTTETKSGIWNSTTGLPLLYWENIFVKSLKKQILEFEPRIVQPQIDAHVEIVEHKLRHQRTYRNQEKSKNSH